MKTLYKKMKQKNHTKCRDEILKNLARKRQIIQK